MSYLRYAAVRILQTVPVLFGVSVIVFIIIHSAPGDPVVNMLGIEATEENIEALRARHGLDEPLYVQYLDWLGRMLQGDMGRSITEEGRTVFGLITTALPATLFLAVASMAVALVIAIPAGIISAVRKGTAADYSVTIGALTGISVPNFWLGLMLILLFARTLGWLPPGNYVSPTEDLATALVHVALPAVTVGTAFTALIARQTRSSMLDVLNRDSVRLARAKGLSSRKVLVRHALKQALLPVVTVAGLQFGYLLSATVVVEQIFAWPGLGRLVFRSVLSQDYPTVQGTVLVIAAMFVFVNLIVDMTYSYLDPRVGR